MARGRPATPLGTHGEIRLYPVAHGYRARTYFRDYDGKSRVVQRDGKTKTSARRALVEAVRDRSTAGTRSRITPSSRISDVAEVWFSGLADLGRSPSTIQMYRDRLDKQILPSLGDVRLAELTVGLIDRHLAAIKHNHGPAMAKLSKSVLSGVCGLACRHDALPSNPCRDVARISTKPGHAPRSLSFEELQQLRAFLTYDNTAIARDLVDLVAFLAATGIRIGEACAMSWDDVDLGAGTAEVKGTVLRLKGQGLIVKPEPKSQAGARILELPTWCVGMLDGRFASDPSSLQLFPAPSSRGLRDPSNTRRGIRDAMKTAGLHDVTSHTFRRIVATMMDEGGLSARAAADQLGHAQVQMTLNKYMGRKKRSTGAAALLERLGRT